MTKRSLVIYAMVAFLYGCNKDPDTCWECYEIAISNAANICDDPEKIETGSPENINVYCNVEERDQYLADHPPTSMSVERDCNGQLLYPIVTRSAICDRVR